MVLLRSVTRIVGTLTLAFLLFMLIGHLIGHANGPDRMHFHHTPDLLAFVCFPVLTIIGLALAYRNGVLGGGLVLGSIGGLIALRPDLLQTPIWLWTIPGVLHLVDAWYSRKMGRVTG